MTKPTRTILAVAALATLGFGCGGSDKVPAAETAARTDMQPPVEVAGSKEKVATNGHLAAEPGDHNEMAKRKDKKKIDPNTPMGKAQMLIEGGKYVEAAAQFKSITSAEPDNQKAWLMYGYSLHAAGNLDEALDAHMQASKFDKVAGTALYNAACVHSLQGNADKAFEALDQAVAAGFHGYEHMEQDEDLTNIRTDARFPAFVQRAKLAHDKAEAEWKAKKGHNGDHKM